MLRAMGMFAFLAAALPATATEVGVNLWIGTWVLKDAGDKPETLVYSDAGGGAMRMVSIEAKSVIVTRFDGKPAADKGAGASEGALAVKADSPTRYRWIYFRKGKPFVTGINTLRPGGRAFDEVSWLVAKPVEKVTLVYERR